MPASGATLIIMDLSACNTRSSRWRCRVIATSRFASLADHYLGIVDVVLQNGILAEQCKCFAKTVAAHDQNGACFSHAALVWPAWVLCKVIAFLKSNVPKKENQKRLRRPR